MVTAFWLSSAVEKTWLFFVGMVVLRSISRVKTPPRVSMPSDSGGDVEQQDVLHVALEHTGLDRRADRDDLVGVDRPVGLLAEQRLHRFDDLGHAGHAADQDDLVDLAGGQPGIAQRRLARTHRALDQVVDQRLELGAGDLDVEVLGAGLVGGDERQVHLGLLAAGQFDLGLLGGLLEPLQGELVPAQIDRLVLLELVGQILDDPAVEVLAAEKGVAVGRFDLEDAVADLQDRDVEGPAAEIVDRDRPRPLLLQPVGERGGGRLVDDPQDIEPGDLSGILGRLTLGVVEIGGHGDHRFGDRLAEMRLGGLLHLLQDEGRHLAGRVFLAVRLDPGIAVARLDDPVGDQVLVLPGRRVVEGAADQPLDREQRVRRVGHRLPLGGLTDEAFLVVGERHHRRRRPRAFGVLDDPRVRTVHDRDTGVGRAEIDADGLTHVDPRSLRRTRAALRGAARVPYG